MHISQITCYSNQSRNIRPQKSMTKNASLNFKGYKEAYSKAIAADMPTVVEAARVYLDLVTAIREMKNTKVSSKLQQLPNILPELTGLNRILESLKMGILKENLEIGLPLISDHNGFPILSVGNFWGLSFKNQEVDPGGALNFSIDKGEISIDYSGGGYWHGDKFYPYTPTSLANRKSHYESSGTNNFNSTSKCTNYNEDGTEKTWLDSLKKFFNS